MATLKLIGTPASRGMRNIWMLEELGLLYEIDPISFKDPALKAPPYIDWNPNGTIPTLLIDGQAIFESLAINLYLAGKYASPMAGRTPEEGGLMAQWTLWAATTMESDMGAWYYNTAALPEPERSATVAADALNRLKKPLAVLNTILATRPVLVGEAFSVADLNVAAVAYRGLSMPIITDYPHVHAWLQRCWSRPAALKARRLRGENV
jgi:glutathione S-transferase